MIEMLGVLAVIGVLSAGGVWGYNMAMTQYRTNQTIEDIQTMVSAARAVLTGKHSDDIINISPVNLLSLGIIPSKYKINDPAHCGKDLGLEPCMIKSVFGKNVKLRVMYGIYGTGGKSNSVFGFWLYDLLEAVCAKMISFDWRTTVREYAWGTYAKRQWITQGNFIPATIDGAKTLCKGATMFYLGFSLEDKNMKYNL